MTPDEGAVVTQTATARIPGTITGGPANAYGIYVRVSLTPDVGTDGQTLSDLHTLDYFVMAGSSTDVGVYRGVSNAGPTRVAQLPGHLLLAGVGQLDREHPRRPQHARLRPQEHLSPGAHPDPPHHRRRPATGSRAACAAGRRAEPAVDDDRHGAVLRARDHPPAHQPRAGRPDL